MSEEQAYFASADPAIQDKEAIVRLIQSTNWAENRPRDVILKSLEHSLVFGVFRGKEEVGCARIITDYATYAYLCDVIIAPEHRKKGLSKMLMQAILTHPALKSIRRFSLLTRDAQGLYRKFGFENHPEPDRYMQIFDRRDQAE